MDNEIIQRKGTIIRYPNYAKREEKEFDELICHHIPDDWPDDLVYTSSLIWEVSEEMQQRYREYSTLQECSQIRFRRGRLVLHTIIDLQETCLVDEYTGFIISDRDLDSCLRNPNRVFLHYNEELDEYLWVDSSQIGNETRYMRREQKGHPDINAKLQHIILDGEMRVFVELTKDIKMGDEFVVEHFIPRHLEQEKYAWPEERDDYFTSSHDLLQSCMFGQAPQLIYDKLPDNHYILQAKRCLWDYVVIGDVLDKNHPCYGQRGCFARVFLPKGTYLGQYTGEVWVCNGTSMSMYVAKYSNSYDEKATEDVRIDSEKIGNETRYFNDYRNTGKETNAQFVMVWIAGTLQLYVGATRDIEKGEEILIDYGPEYWEAVKDMSEYEVYEKKYQKELEEYEDYRRQLKEYAEYQRDLLKYRDNYFKQYGTYPTDIDDLDKEFSYENWQKEEEQFLKDHGYQTKPPEERKRLEEIRLQEEKEKEHQKSEEKKKKWGVEMRTFDDQPERKFAKGTTSIKRITVFGPKRPKDNQNPPKKEVPDREAPQPPVEEENSAEKDNNDNEEENSVIENNNKSSNNESENDSEQSSSQSNKESVVSESHENNLEEEKN